jgi:hypothetical protein
MIEGNRRTISRHGNDSHHTELSIRLRASANVVNLIINPLLFVAKPLNLPGTASHSNNKNILIDPPSLAGYKANTLEIYPPTRFDWPRSLNPILP